MYVTLKRWSLLPFATILLSIHPTLTEVVTSMADCPGFLLLEKTPNVPGVLENGRILDQNRYKVICQTFENKRRFVTLYDTRNKIPVFSAFKYRGTDGTKSERPRGWMMEPQLEPTATINMRNDQIQNQNQNQVSAPFSSLC
ncbi:hypothetical protein CesoFtcFv8_026559 [Champsocephalus esox]|uniref:Uncharacterized protein n=1 Tax=Champsocephalus esox TaxID=159716 RepID=A0AAN8G8G1_9TELE|nr:hypothetical protein CesoFtcFv8_026559 [Champsocephalus esox]KAK5875480.1 hypothetical protein CesoFtcFv8_026559 [Champsocephalus esox]